MWNGNKSVKIENIIKLFTEGNGDCDHDAYPLAVAVHSTYPSKTRADYEHSAVEQTLSHRNYHHKIVDAHSL